jgi:N6-L-threonylcarbamoyladenine synthase
MEVLGETIDDAVGEAFDKSAKILGLKYPGGPLIDKHAKLGNPKAFPFTKPKVGDLDFSFSGLKTGVLYFIQKQVKINPKFIEENLNDICASIQYTIIEILMDKLKNAAKKTGIKHIAIAGGVSANSEIRNRLQLAEKHFGWTTYIPKFEKTTDNAAMIAITGYLK